MALNAYNRLSSNNASVSKNLEKLSSGYRINRAGDDTAGLAISEKMRAQITGLERASDNAQDGISLVQTAEGALTEVHSMLNRMVELATQSSNSTFDSTTDRANLQSEMDALKSEVDRIASETNFNGIKLLDGTLGNGVNATGAILGASTAASNGVDVAASTSKFTTGAISQATAANPYNLTVTYTDSDGISKNVTVSYTGGADAATTRTNISNAIAGNSTLSQLFNVANNGADALDLTSKVTGATAPVVTDITTADTGKIAAGTSVESAGAGKQFAVGAANVSAGNSISINGKTFSFFANAGDSAPEGAIAVLVGADGAASMGNLQSAVDSAGIKNVSVKMDAANNLLVTSNGEGLGLQIGDTASQRITVKVDSMSSTSLGLGSIDISNENTATDSIQTIKTAINTVSSTRADLGAIQNRLEYTVNNLATTTENLTSAESRIRDTDMAKEMMAYTKNNVLSQAAQAMLAQANQQPQSVLQLLQ